MTTLRDHTGRLASRGPPPPGCSATPPPPPPAAQLLHGRAAQAAGAQSPSNGEAALTSGELAAALAVGGGAATPASGLRLRPVWPATQKAILKTPHTPTAAISTAPAAARGTPRGTQRT